MNLQLTSKEKTMLQDQLKHETICIQKYEKYASESSDPQLKQLFNSLVSQEQHHFATIQQMLNGQAPNLQQGQGGQQGQQQQSQQQNPAQMSQGGGSQGYQGAGSVAGQASQNSQNMQMIQGLEGDATLCTDSMMTEKFISSSYDTGVFESSNQQVIQALQHIQKEEQEHGQQLKQYMESNGMQ